MPQTPHVEKHFTSSETVRDIVIGMSDGLTVPFALAAGLSAGLSDTMNASNIIITAGLAEVAAGSIAMGLGGYLAAKTDAEHFVAEEAREYREIQEVPDFEIAEVADVFRSYGLSADVVDTVTKSICSDEKRWVDFMMRFELGLEKPDPRRAARSALTIAFSYIAGGLVPLSPYFFLPSPARGLPVFGLIGSIFITLFALFVFGYIKGRFTTTHPFRSAWQTVFVGGLAASAAFLIAKWIG